MLKRTVVGVPKNLKIEKQTTVVQVRTKNLSKKIPIFWYKFSPF